MMTAELIEFSRPVYRGFAPFYPEQETYDAAHPGTPRRVFQNTQLIGFLFRTSLQAPFMGCHPKKTPWVLRLLDGHYFRFVTEFEARSYLTAALGARVDMVARNPSDA